MTPRPVVLFDFDGTLADTIPLIIESYRHTLAASGLPAVDEPQIRSWIGRTLEDVFEERYPGRSAELTDAYHAWNRAHHDELIRGVDGMRGLLDQLAGEGRPTGVVTSKQTSTVHLGLRAVGLEGAIEVLAGKGDTAEHKPSPAPLLHAAGVLGVHPCRCVYVGDATVDMVAAQAAGMAPVGVSWGAATRAELLAAGAQVVVDDVPSLAAALTPPIRGRSRSYTAAHRS